VRPEIPSSDLAFNAEVLALVLSIFLDDAVIQTGGLALNILPEGFENLRESIHSPANSKSSRAVVAPIRVSASKCCAMIVVSSQK
jgi:hypothetical protein